MAKKIPIGTSDEKKAFAEDLESHFQSGNLNFLIGSGASMPAIKVAGNIESEINKLLEDGKLNDADRKAFEFLEELEDINRDVLAEISGAEIDAAKNGYSDFLRTLDELLFARKNVLLPRQANVFTTNYDSFIEMAANELSTLALNDGFDRTIASKLGFPFKPETYSDRIFRSGKVYERHSEVPSVNLVKLHGSLTWRKNQEEDIRFDAGETQPLAEEDKKDINKIKYWLSTRAVILPNMRKFESTVMDRVYFDLLRLFSNSLDKENALLIAFGFSFGDEHILDVTKRALRNPTAKLIVFAYEERDSVEFEAKFSQQRNVAIVSPSDTEKIDFSMFNSLLKSIVPMRQKLL